ncbi:Syd protein [Streptomyces sp. NBRC 110611]|nr:Syd protein [Streptomyces sp. NBRC 110611]
MRSPRIALCAAVACCAVTTMPAYGNAPALACGVDARSAGTATLSAATPLPAVAPLSVAPSSVSTPAQPAPARSDPARSARVFSAPVSSVPAPSEPAAHSAARRELSSTSAVGLVLAGGTVLVIAGQLLRLRLRLRRERRSDADES